jgi:hypothetical protein
LNGRATLASHTVPDTYVNQRVDKRYPRQYAYGDLLKHTLPFDELLENRSSCCGPAGKMKYRYNTFPRARARRHIKL